ncbi:MAG: SMI1/KNR4 family protein [Actinomycetota bacterium]
MLDESWRIGSERYGNPPTNLTIQPPATQAQITATERALGVSFPADLRSIYLVTNGGPFPTPSSAQWTRVGGTSVHSMEERSQLLRHLLLEPEFPWDYHGNYAAGLYKPAPDFIDLTGSQFGYGLEVSGPRRGHVIGFEVVELGPFIGPTLENLVRYQFELYCTYGEEFDEKMPDQVPGVLAAKYDIPDTFWRSTNTDS